MDITRKEFLNRSSALAAASILTPFALHAKAFGNADKKIKVGVIGCGMFRPVPAPSFKITLCRTGVAAIST